MPFEPPPEGTLERWAHDYLTSDSLAFKTAPPALPDQWESEGVSRVVDQPGRPPELNVVWDKVKTPSVHALKQPLRRAQLLHTFWHHELQAAELMCRSMLRFHDAPQAFRRGLLNIALDEVRHMQLYAKHIESLGYHVGAFPVRDWFWSRAPAAESPLQFVALMGVGFEAGNLDHTERFAQRFDDVGDHAGAALQRKVGEEEVPHVAFGVHWFEKFGGPLKLSSWCDALPAPLSPMVMRGRPINRKDRARAGMDDQFLDALEQWQPTRRGC